MVTTAVKNRNIYSNTLQLVINNLKKTMEGNYKLNARNYMLNMRNYSRNYILNIYKSRNKTWLRTLITPLETKLNSEYISNVFVATPP